MLKSLSIKNYAIIDSLEIEFHSGLSIITGETGAGKSIFIGALSLVLGGRVELAQIKNKDKKCIIEAVFDVEKYNLKSMFSENDIDFEESTIFRREILPKGKSRAFINDTPVNLNIIKSLGLKLIDIHSQHQSLMIGDNQFQLMVVDEIAGLRSTLTEYQSIFNSYLLENIKLSGLVNQAQQSKKDHDFLVFQFNQLDTAGLNNLNEVDELENDLRQLNHAEEIKQSLQTLDSLLSNDDDSVLNILNNSLGILDRIKSYFGKGEEFLTRISSVEIELKDIADEIDILSYEIEYDPARINTLTERLDLINSLLQKNQVSTVDELIELRNLLDKKIQDIDSYEERIKDQQAVVNRLEKKAYDLAGRITRKRLKVAPGLEKKVESLLHKLGMTVARFSISISESEKIHEYGTDEILFLFSSSKKGEMQEINKIASGGELSRLMLCVKSLIAQSANLPTIVFDEIDTGVSGEIADKVGNIIKDISRNLQVINITHLPQVAVKGDKHFRIYKIEEDEGANTFIELLDAENRVHEIAKMLSGSDVTKAAIENARILMKDTN